MTLDLEDAKKYYLVPLKNQESLYWIGDKKHLLALEMVMDAKDVVATTEINTETCYILVNKTNEECEELRKQMKEVLKKGSDADNKGKPKEDKKVR